MHTSLINYLLYQLGWFACVVGAGVGHPVAGTIVGVTSLVSHLALADRPRDEAMLAGAAALLGVGVDALQIHLGTMHFPPHANRPSIHPALPPLWMSVLWAQFATTIHYSMSWLCGGWRRACVFGAAGGPLAFWAGARLGAVHLDGPPWLALLVLAGLWSVAVPALVAVATRGGAPVLARRYRWTRR